MLKAIGASNLTIVMEFVLQITVITLFGIFLGGIGTLLLSLSFPPTIPISFTAENVMITIFSLLLIGPLGGLVSLRILLKVEPLTALGLTT